MNKNTQNIPPVFQDLLHSMQKNSEQTAIVDKDGNRYTYLELSQTISGAYHELQKRGIQKGDKILIAVPMSFQLYAVLEAIFALGATAIFLDPWMKGKKMGSVIRQVQPELFIVTRKISYFTWLLPATWKLKKWKLGKIIPSEKKYAIADIKNEDDALITFTSGTSGTPKGANRTFGFLEAQSNTLKAHLQSDDQNSVEYTNFPIVGLAHFELGNTLVIPQINLMKIHQCNAEKVIEHLLSQKVQRIIVSPSLLQKILSALPKKHDVKSVITGGAPIPSQLVRTAIEQFPEINFEGIYGSTEAEPICITPFKDIYQQLQEPLKGVYVGKPVDEIQLKIMRVQNGPVSTTEFKNACLNEKETGEIVVTGDHVNKSYYKNPKAFEKNKIVDENGTIWHRTGDVGYLEKGHLYLVGRDHRIIEKDGQTFYPYPVEQYLESSFGWSDVGYVQNSDGVIKLYLYSRKKVDTEAVLEAVRKIDYPVDYVVVSKKPLPRDARHRSKLQIENL